MQNRPPDASLGAGFYMWGKRADVGIGTLWGGNGLQRQLHSDGILKVTEIPAKAGSCIK